MRLAPADSNAPPRRSAITISNKGMDAPRSGVRSMPQWREGLVVVMLVLLLLDLPPDLPRRVRHRVDVCVGHAGPDGVEHLGELSRRDPLRDRAARHIRCGRGAGYGPCAGGARRGGMRRSQRSVAEVGAKEDDDASADRA